MSTEANPHVPRIELPERPSETEIGPETGEPRAVRATRTREEAPGTLSALGAAWVARTLPAMVSGSSLWASQPPSLATYWAGHAASARYYEAGVFRWPRYAWGVVHIVILVPIYLLGWVTHSFPLLFLTAAAVAVGFWLL